jgi:hypothetical protein
MFGDPNKGQEVFSRCADELGRRRRKRGSPLLSVVRCESERAPPAIPGIGLGRPVGPEPCPGRTCRPVGVPGPRRTAQPERHHVDGRPADPAAHRVGRGTPAPDHAGNDRRAGPDVCRIPGDRPAGQPRRPYDPVLGPVREWGRVEPGGGGVRLGRQPDFRGGPRPDHPDWLFGPTRTERDSAVLSWHLSRESSRRQGWRADAESGARRSSRHTARWSRRSPRRR